MASHTCHVCGTGAAIYSPTFGAPLCLRCWGRCSGHADWDGRGVDERKVAQAGKTRQMGAQAVLEAVRQGARG